MWEIVELDKERYGLFKPELDQVSARDRSLWSGNFVYQHKLQKGVVGFTPGLFIQLSEHINFLNDFHPIALKEVSNWDQWSFFYGDEKHFTFLQNRGQF